jgi:ubiquinone/menaquinone biosynthesis C-methylase UbiE
VDVPSDVKDEQARLWNGPSGQAWVENQELLDQLYKPFEDLLVQVASATPRRAVLDVGCGAGATTIAIARGIDGAVDGATEVAPYVHHASGAPECVGVDISEPLIAAARSRAEREHTPATFICANAQTYAFEPATFDLIVSRFGIMFFDDPVAAFANLRRATRDGGELRVIPWRSAAENPFMTTAERAAASLLPNLPPRRPNAPGQFALADKAAMHGILDASGWSDIDIRALDVTCTMPASELAQHVTRLGPVGLALQEADAATRARVTEAVLAAFEPFVHGDDVRFTAACWMVAARNTPD